MEHAGTNIEQRAGTGDAEALFALANWRLYGLHGPRDAAAAHRLLRDAAGRGHVEAARTRAHLIANGIGVPADPDRAKLLMSKIADRDPGAARQLERLKRIPAPASHVREPVSASPEILIACGLLAPEECRYIIDLAQPALQPSFVIDPATGGRMPHPARTSHGTNFGPTQEDLVINRINRRLAAATGHPIRVGRAAPHPALHRWPGV